MPFGSPASDYVEPKLDLNQLLIKHPVATYFVRMNSDNLNDYGIFKEDILTIDRSLIPLPQQLVLYENQDGFIVQKYPPQSSTTCSIFGVVTSIIRQLVNY